MAQELYYRQSIKIKAAVEKVWDALVNPAITKKYMFGCEALSDGKVGSELIWKGEKDGIIYVKGHITKYEPNTVFAYTVFDPNSNYKDIPSNYLTVEYVLSFADGITTLDTSQGDYSKVEDGQKRFEDSASGWDMVLQAIKSLLEA